MSPEKLAVLASGSIPSYHARSFTVMKMAQGFSALGFETEVVTSDSINSRVMTRKIPDFNAHYGLSHRIPVQRISPSLIAFLTGRTSHDRAYSFRAAHYTKENGFQLAYCRSYLIPYFTATLGVPTFVETHTVAYDHPALQKVYEVAHLPALKGLVTIHESIKQEHIKRGVPEEKILVLEDGVDIQRFLIEDDALLWKRQLNLDPDKKYVTYCGHLYPEKAIDVIISVAKRLEQRSNVVFLLVGGLEKWQRHWKRYCAQRQVTNVQFAGFVPNAEVPKYLKAADCLLLPYRLDLEHRIMDVHTTSPLKLFEYMAAKRAIVATGIPTVAKVLHNHSNALLAAPGDIDEFCRLVERTLDNPDVNQALGVRAFGDVQQYTWERRCKAVLDSLES